jgi:hypothetical protein
MSRDDGSRKIGGREIGKGPYEGEGKQAGDPSGEARERDC